MWDKNNWKNFHYKGPHFSINLTLNAINQIIIYDREHENKPK